MRSTGIEIDGKKLKKELLRRGLTCAEVSREMGFNPSYLSNHISSGFTTAGTVKMLETLYNVKYESFQPEKTEPEQEPQQTTLPEVFEAKEASIDIDYQRLWKCIYTATYEAVKKAWVEV